MFIYSPFGFKTKVFYNKQGFTVTGNMPIRGHLPTGCGGARVVTVVEGAWWWNMIGGEVLVGPERSAV